MKKIIFAIILILSCLLGNAMKIEQLLKICKNLPDIQYEEIKGKELKRLIEDTTTSEIEKEVLSNSRKIVILGFMSGMEENKEISSHLNSLKGYSLAMSFTMTLPHLDSPIAVDVYSEDEPSGEYLTKPIFLINLWGIAGMVYIDGKLKPETAKDFIQVTYSTNFKNSEAPQKRSVLDRLDIQRSIYPQEKLHVVTDRELYCGGDTIWLRAFVVDADTHVQTAISKYAYVELLTPFGYADKRVKLMERDGVYAGYIPVDEDIYEGDYTLTAYTAYAENQGSDYFFRKPLKILAPQSSKYVIEPEFTPSGEGEVKGNFKIKAINNAPINYKVMSWTMPNGDFLEMPHAKKGVSRKFSREKDENVVLVKFGDYGRFFPMEYPIERTDLVFYPEGGWLIADQPCTVAFKATEEKGKVVSSVSYTHLTHPTT